MESLAVKVFDLLDYHLLLFQRELRIHGQGEYLRSGLLGVGKISSAAAEMRKTWLEV